MDSCGKIQKGPNVVGVAGGSGGNGGGVLCDERNVPRDMSAVRAGTAGASVPGKSQMVLKQTEGSRRWPSLATGSREQGKR